MARVNSCYSFFEPNFGASEDTPSEMRETA